MSIASTWIQTLIVAAIVLTATTTIVGRYVPALIDAPRSWLAGGLQRCGLVGLARRMRPTPRSSAGACHSGARDSCGSCGSCGSSAGPAAPQSTEQPLVFHPRAPGPSGR